MRLAPATSAATRAIEPCDRDGPFVIAPRTPPESVASEPSDDSRDKMLAALSWGLEKQVVSCVTAPHYFNACRQRYDGLSAEQREIVAKVMEAYTYWGEIAAKRIASGLPPAPRCPL